MHFDVHLRGSMRQGIEALVQQMREWETAPRVDEGEAERIRAAIQPFPHTTQAAGLRVAGVDGTGDFPALAYGDSFVYFTLAQATCYEADPLCGLREVDPTPEPVIHLTWLPEDETHRRGALDAAFAALAGQAVDEVIAASDYSFLKAAETGRAHTASSLRHGLIYPHAADAGNLAVQLRSTAELGAALRFIRNHTAPKYLMMDGTHSLPFVSRREISLFHEHLKRLCCVEARTQGVGFFSLSKSHGLPSGELLEELARERLGLEPGRTAEHWYLRVPEAASDGWTLSLAEGRRLPPAGAVTYLVRFHRTTPLLRLDMDRGYWAEQVRDDSEEETRANEQRLFGELDYASHDQRAYGYPYPIKAGHDRASLTRAERVALRKKIIDEAVRVGMRRSLFRDASLATGHE